MYKILVSVWPPTHLVQGFQLSSLLALRGRDRSGELRLCYLGGSEHLCWTANKQLAWSSKAAAGWASFVGVPQQRYDGDWPPQRHTKRSPCRSHICRGFGGITCWFSGRRRGVQPWQRPPVCLSEIPREAGCWGRRRWFFHSLRPQGKQENGSITGPTTELRKRTHPAESRCALDGNAAWNEPHQRRKGLKCVICLCIPANVNEST